MRDDLKAWTDFMSPGGTGWFVTLVGELLDIRSRFGALIADELIAVDLCADPAWRDLAALPKHIQHRWVRLAKIEVDHRLVEEDIQSILEARELGDRGAVRSILKPLPKNLENRIELTEAERQVWIERAALAARGQFDEFALEQARTRRADLACATVPRHSTGIYFLTTDQSDVKIGYAGNVIARRRTLQTGNARPLLLLLSIPGNLKDEHALHQRFAAYRIHNEWFRLTGDLAAFIEAERAKR